MAIRPRKTGRERNIVTGRSANSLVNDPSRGGVSRYTESSRAPLLPGWAERSDQLRDIEDMRRMIVAAFAACITGTSALAAQPGGRMGPGPMGPGPGAMGEGGGGPISNPAEFLLARTGELRLTDAQVTRLAAIARRGADRRRAMRASLDSIRPERGPGMRPDSAARAQLRQRAEQMRPALERLREQSQADRRDAIAVLTPDQQAQAWEQISVAGRSFNRGGGGPRGMGMRRGESRREMRPERPMRRRPPEEQRRPE